MLNKQKEVLLLNSSYLPLNVISVQKAMLLIFNGKATIIKEVENKLIHSKQSIFPYPDVIRLNFFVRVPYKPLIPTKKAVLIRDGFCQYCGSDKHLTIDHIVPVSKGGLNTWENMVAACHSCNSRKGNRTPEEVGMRLLKEPKKPLFVVKSKTSWNEFIFKS